MTQITNLTSQSLSFPVGRDKDGDVRVKDVAPGETETVDIDPKSPIVTGRVAGGAISVGRAPKAEKPAAAKPARAVPATPLNKVEALST